MTTRTPAERTDKAIQARRHHVNVLLKRVREAITELHKDHARITVSAVVRRSGVSRTFLYQNADARTLVEEAIARAEGYRAQHRQQAADNINASWRERALNAEDGLKQAVAEVQTQRRRIGELLGKIRDLELDLPADAVQRLTTENSTLKREIQTLTADNRKLTERLAASRDNYRAQEREIANLQGLLLEHDPQAAARHLRPVGGS
jgi:chromosome segregation ATPase